MRPYLLFISGIAGFAGMSLAIQKFDVSSLLAFIAFFLAYGFGQALTDCFQIDTDSISAPYRPLSKKIISPKTVAVTSLVMLTLCAATFIYFNTLNILFGALSIFGLATYSTIKKRYWFGGPLYNAWIVAMLPIMGFLVSSGGDLELLRSREVVIIILLNFFAYANFVLIGYLKDITADKKTGYRTFPVVFGWNPTVFIGDLFVIISIWLCSRFAFSNIQSIIFFILGTVSSISGQLYAHFTTNKSEKNATYPIASTVRSFILLNLSVILSIHPKWILPAVIYFLIFELVLWKRPSRGQI